MYSRWRTRQTRQTRRFGIPADAFAYRSDSPFARRLGPASIANRFPPSCRHEGKTREELRTRVKQLRRDAREFELAAAIEQQTHLLGVQRFGVIYADPPWRFEPYSPDTGMDRAPQNHYPTMTQDALAELELPAGEDCVLFYWTTVAMLPAGLAFLSDHGFTYRSAYFWHKPGAGTGYWSTTDQVEILLVGTMGNPPAPAPGKQPPQMLTLPRGRHSEKPEEFTEMIEAMFPTVPRLEIFFGGITAGLGGVGQRGGGGGGMTTELVR
jgi:N6-adenosine-specific RNA methylase IME4